MLFGAALAGFCLAFNTRQFFSRLCDHGRMISLLFTAVFGEQEGEAAPGTFVMPFLDKVDEWVADAAFVLFLAGVDFHTPFEALFQSFGGATVIF
ncbi:hypothetical protein [Klebsiella pneumoniae]|uniref:hypothetical protein n=1 Tax=Klebsiella pneumoniae TaxID=573 RepID=UPI00376EB3B7